MLMVRLSVSSSGANAGNLVIALEDADREVAVQNLDDATPDNIIVGAGFNAGVSSLPSKPIAVMLAPKVTVSDVIYDAASKTLEFVAGTDKFDPNVAVRDYDMSKVTLTINSTATTLDQLESSTTAASVVTSGVNAGNLVVTLDERAAGVSDLADATADTIVIGADFNSGVNELASKAITVQAAGGGSKVTVSDVIYDAASKTLEFVAGTDKFDPNVAVRDYDMSKVSLTINSTATTLDQLESSTTAASVVTSGVNAGNLVVTLDERATGVSDLADATADTIVIGADFNTGVNELASKPITVAPASGHSEINFLVDVVGGKFRIFDEGMNKFVGEGNSPDGIAPELEFVPGHTYIFTQVDANVDVDGDGNDDLIASSNSTHPLWISSTENYSSGTVYSAGIRSGTKVTILAEGTNGVGRKIKVEIDPNEPATDLWYVCQNHNGGNESDIVTAAGSSDYEISYVDTLMRLLERLRLAEETISQPRLLT